MATKVRSDQIRNGRYFQGGTVDATSDAIGWWEARIFPRAPSDVEIEITSKYACNPSLLAFDAYGLSELGWFILQYNNIVDDNEEFIEGSKIMLPTAQRLNTDLLNKAVSASPSISNRN